MYPAKKKICDLQKNILCPAKQILLPPSMPSHPALCALSSCPLCSSNPSPSTLCVLQILHLPPSVPSPPALFKSFTSHHLCPSPSLRVLQFLLVPPSVSFTSHPVYISPPTLCALQVLLLPPAVSTPSHPLCPSPPTHRALLPCLSLPYS